MGRKLLGLGISGCCRPRLRLYLARTESSCGLPGKINQVGGGEQVHFLVQQSFNFHLLISNPLVCNYLIIYLLFTFLLLVFTLLFTYLLISNLSVLTLTYLEVIIFPQYHYIIYDMSSTLHIRVMNFPYYNVHRKM